MKKQTTNQTYNLYGGIIMKTMKVETTLMNAYLAELERAREIYEIILANKDADEAEEALKQMVDNINAKYNMS
jgi:hypothetical protein